MKSAAVILLIDRMNKSTQRAQTSANAKISTESNPGFEFAFSD